MMPPKPSPPPAGFSFHAGFLVYAGEKYGVLIDSVHWEHYCCRVEEMDMSSLDEANFLSGSLGVLASMVLALIGVLWGTSHPSPYLVAILVTLLIGSGVLSWFFWRRYDNARKDVRKTGETISKEMREIAEAQRAREAAERG